jgi:FkbM family methyltransferase
MPRWQRFARARAYRLGLALQEAATVPGYWQARRRKWEMSHVQRLKRWAEEGFKAAVILDIGANSGEWSEMCGKFFEPRLICLVEPQSAFHQQIAGRAKAKRGEWRLFPVALGDSPSELTLHLTENRAASSLLRPLHTGVPSAWGTGAVATEKVRVERLDDLWRAGRLEAPDLVKIDVQGFEGAVVSGGREVLSRCQRLVVEVSLAPIYEGQPLIGEMIQTLGELGLVVEDISETCRSWPDGKLWQVDLWMRRKGA